MTATTITTDRLTLRAPAASDLAAYVSFYAVSDTKVEKYRYRTSAAEIQAILDQDIAHWSKGFGMWLITLSGDATVVGGAGICHPDDWPSHELTWWLMPDQRGHGYATEANRAVISFAYDNLGWPMLETHFRDENTAARKLATRLGGAKIRRDQFPDNVWRDVYALPKHQSGPQP